MQYREQWLVLDVHRDTSFLPSLCSSHERLFFGADSLIFSLESMLVLVFLIQCDSTNAYCLGKSGWDWPWARVRLGESPAQVLCSPWPGNDLSPLLYNMGLCFSLCALITFCSSLVIYMCVQSLLPAGKVTSARTVPYILHNPQLEDLP